MVGVWCVSEGGYAGRAFRVFSVSSFSLYYLGLTSDWRLGLGRLHTSGHGGYGAARITEPSMGGMDKVGRMEGISGHGKTLEARHGMVAFGGIGFGLDDTQPLR